MMTLGLWTQASSRSLFQWKRPWWNSESQGNTMWNQMKSLLWRVRFDKIGVMLACSNLVKPHDEKNMFNPIVKSMIGPLGTLITPYYISFVLLFPIWAVIKTRLPVRSAGIRTPSVTTRGDLVPLRFTDKITMKYHEKQFLSIKSN